MATATIVLVGGLALAGCTESVEEASGDFCSNLDTVDAELAALESLVAGDATVDELEEQHEAVVAAYEDLAASSGDLDEAVASEADSAYDTYQSAIDAIPGEATLSEAAVLYADAAGAYLADLATIAVNADCDS